MYKVQGKKMLSSSVYVACTVIDPWTSYMPTMVLTAESDPYLPLPFNFNFLWKHGSRQQPWWLEQEAEGSRPEPQHKAERMYWKWCMAFNSQSLALVTHFPQQDHTP